MSKAIYLKTEEEKCFCMFPLKDGTEYEVRAIKSEQNFLKVNGYSKGHFGCLVYYNPKNFIMTSEIDENEMVRESHAQKILDVFENTKDVYRYLTQFTRK